MHIFQACLFCFSQIMYSKDLIIYYYTLHGIKLVRYFKWHHRLVRHQMLPYVLGMQPIPAPKVIPFYTTTFELPNVIIMISLILVTASNVILSLGRYFYFGLILASAPNAFLGSLFISPHCPHAVFERSTDRE